MTSDIGQVAIVGKRTWNGTTIRVAGVLVVAFLLVGMAAPVATAAAATPTPGLLTVVPPNDFFQCYGACLESSPGGAVMGPSRVHVIFWLPDGYSFEPGVAGGDAQYMSLVQRFFGDVGGSELYNLVTQYPDTDHRPPNSLVLDSTYIDKTPIPNPTIHDVDLQNEIRAAKVANHWPDNTPDLAQELYFIYTPAQVTTCVDLTNTVCSGYQFAAYHGYFNDAGFTNPTPYGFVADLSTGAGGPNYPNGALIDQILSSTSHELFETVTDPYGSGWTHFFGAFGEMEMADLCQDAAYGQDATGANVHLNGHPYQLQLEFSNAAPGCTNGFDGQFIDFAPLSPKTTASPPFALTASTTSLLPLSFGTSGPCTVAAGTVTITGSGTCTITASQPGNKATGGFYDPATPVQRSFSITDVTAPVAAPTVTPVPNAAGWVHSVPAVVDWHWTDVGSGVDPAQCAGSASTSAEGITMLPGSCTDLSANPGSAEQTVRVDTIAPAVAVTGPTNGAVYAVGAVPAASCSTTDSGGSGVATNAAAVTIGGPLFFTVTCQGGVDVAGNLQAAPVSVSYTVDGTAPSLIPGVSGTLGQNGWYVGDVTVSWTVLDLESPVTASSCPGGSVTADTTGSSFGCTATSTGGTSATSVTVKRDATAPSASVTGVVNGASYSVGSLPTAGCSTNDAGGSLVATAATLAWTPAVPAGAGSYTATCSGAVDGAGNQATAATAVITVTSTPVPQQADISIALSCPSTVHVKVAATCTLTVRNAGPIAAKNVGVAVVLAKSLSRVSASAGATLLTSGATWTLASLAPGSSIAMTVTFTPTTTGVAAVGAAAASPTADPSYVNNLASNAVTVTR